MNCKVVSLFWKIPASIGASIRIENGVILNRDAFNKRFGITELDDKDELRGLTQLFSSLNAYILNSFKNLESSFDINDLSH